MSTLDMALFYDHLGCSVLPLRSRSKEPVRSWREYQSRRPERDELRKWFSGGRRNIGIICGDVSDRLIVRDFDSDASYKNWQSEYPDAGPRKTWGLWVWCLIPLLFRLIWVEGQRDAGLEGCAGYAFGSN